jgi:hypothetical protein
MPSEIDTTVPCVRTVAPVSRFWILLLMSSLISDGFNCMVSSRRAGLSHRARMGSAQF